MQPGRAKSVPTAHALPAALDGKGPSGVAANTAPTGWRPLGPAPENSDTVNPNKDYHFGLVSGRATAVVVGQHTPGLIYLGTADGGVWKSTNDGASWAPLTDAQQSLAVGSLALDPADTTDNTLYVGTGEANHAAPDGFNGDSYFGVGVLKTTNGGSSWTLVGNGLPGFGSYGAASVGIGVMVANGATVWAGTTQGLYRSTDSGSTWSLIPVVTAPNDTFRVTDIAVDGSNVYAVLSQTISGFIASGIYKSTANGDPNTFSPIMANLPTATSWGRTQVAIARSAPQTLYLVITTGADNTNGLLGMYKTTDGGTTWSPTAVQPPNYFNGGNGQGDYDNAIAVDPANPNLVYGFGVLAVASTDGGASWPVIADVYCGNAPLPCRGPIHPDMHALAFGPSGSPHPLYVANDGGAWKTTNGNAGTGVIWSDLNTNLATTQFYAGDTTFDYLQNPVAIAGAQDNGTSATGSLSSAPWGAILGGDGGYVGIAKSNPNVVYAEYPQGFVQRTTNANAGAGITWADVPPVGTCTGNAAFIAPFAIDTANANHLIFGGVSFCETEDGGTTWYRSNASLPFSEHVAIQSVAMAPTNSAVQYAGTDGGYVYKTSNGDTGAAATWADCDSNPLPNAPATSIAVDRTNPNTVYATFGNFGVGHVWMTTDCNSWANISGNLPDVPVQSLVTYAASPNPALIVGTDVGVFQSTDNGATWVALQSGLPNVGIQQLFTDPSLTTLFAATHGRGMWKISIPRAGDPSISTVNPPSGATTGGNRVTITGVGFQAGATVRFGDALGTNIVVTGSTQITVTAPPHAAGLVDILVVNPNGHGGTAVGAYTYVMANPAPPSRGGPHVGGSPATEPASRGGPHVGGSPAPAPGGR
ncbi:MAG: IPT/TIG domain-containing protein [Thermomicrobiales bacterium]